MPHRRLLWSAAALTLLWAAPCAPAATTPEISVLGQPRALWTNDPADPDRRHLRLEAGETEFVFKAPLGPRVWGFVTVTLAEGDIELDEGCFAITTSRPLNLGIKGGKYRVGFGQMNRAHRHTYPIAERFRILDTYLPGEESFNEIGISLSRVVALGERSFLSLTADGLQGDSFRITRASTGDAHDPLEGGNGDGEELTRPAFNARLSLFEPLGERSGLELGGSATHGTNNVAARARTTVLGLDAQAKVWRSPRACLLLQGEMLVRLHDEAGWSRERGYTLTERSGAGFYLLADYAFGGRYNVGAACEDFQSPVRGRPWNSALGIHAGYAIIEESLVARAGWYRFIPERGDEADTITLWVVYSMGPHPAHQL
jgi:hypothetical protein